LHEDFFGGFRESGGDIEIVLNHVAMLEEPTGIAFYVEFSPELMSHLSTRGIRLRVQVWSGKPSWAA